MDQPIFSVITPAYNQKDSILWMLQAWNTQQAVFNSFELIISDDGSSDGTQKAVENWKKEYSPSFKITFLSHQDEGFRVARSKNDAIRVAEGKFILVMDGDTFPDNQTVKAFIPHLDENTVLHAKRWRVDPAVLRMPFSWTTLYQHKTRGEWRSEILPDLPPGRYTIFSGANCVIPTKLAKEFLWAPDDWNGYGYDDYHFALRWIASGRKIKFVNSVAWHIEHPNTKGDSMNRGRILELEEELTPKMEKIYGLGWQPPYV